MAASSDVPPQPMQLATDVEVTAAPADVKVATDSSMSLVRGNCTLRYWLCFLTFFVIGSVLVGIGSNGSDDVESATSSNSSANETDVAGTLARAEAVAAQSTIAAIGVQIVAANVAVLLARFIILPLFAFVFVKFAPPSAKSAVSRTPLAKLMPADSLPRAVA